MPFASILTHQGTPTVTLTCVYSSLVVTCAQHGIMDPSGIAFETALFGYQRYFGLHEFLG